MKYMNKRSPINGMGYIVSKECIHGKHMIYLLEVSRSNPWVVGSQMDIDKTKDYLMESHANQY